MAAEFVRRGADRTKLTTIVTGIDAKEIVPVRGVRSTSQGSPVTVGYLGTLARERRLAILVDTIAELRRRGVAACLLIVGDGETKEDRRAIELRAAELGVRDMVRITGFLPRGEALELLKCADVCISPIYRSATFDGASPTKLVEYLALGLPVVANSHPDQTLVVRESRGGLCVPWGARHFARAVYWLISQGDERRFSMGRQGRAWVEKNRSYAGIADEFERGVATASVRIPQ
jgi:glycosyltransferase involved in cell wall biosynthesis